MNRVDSDEYFLYNESTFYSEIEMKYMLAAAVIASTPSAFSQNVWLFSSPSPVPPISTYINSFQQDSLTVLNFALGNYAYTPSAGIENFTGLQVPAHLKSTYERSIDPNWYGASAVQGYEGKFSFFINTDSAPADNNRPDPLYTTNYQVNFSGDIRPWSAVYGNNPGLCNAFFAAVPTSWHGAGSNNQGGSAFNLYDVSTGLFLSTGGLYYDSNPANLVEHSGLDEETGWVWTNANYGSQNYFSTSPGSSWSRSTTWSTEDWFGFCIYKGNLLSIINSANHRIDVVNAVRIQQGKPVLSHYSTDISNYRLNFAVIGGEIAAQRPITGHMGARFREWNIFIQR